MGPQPKNWWAAPTKNHRWLGSICVQELSYSYLHQSRKMIHLVASIRLSARQWFTITSPRSLSVSVIRVCFGKLRISGQSFSDRRERLPLQWHYHDYFLVPHQAQECLPILGDMRKCSVTNKSQVTPAMIRKTHYFRLYCRFWLHFNCEGSLIIPVLLWTTIDGPRDTIITATLTV